MKIITLWQPWASLVALNLKRYETRSWPTNYRGPLLIHAAKRPFVTADNSKVLDNAAQIAWADALALGYEAGLLNDQSKMPFGHRLPLGAVVAIANLIDCGQMVDTNRDDPRASVANPIYIQAKATQLEQAVGHWESGRYAWRLSDVQCLVEPIPWRGGQGLRDAPPELQALIEAATKTYADGIPF